MIFLGTVTKLIPARQNEFPRARMRIDQAFKGVSESSLTLFDNLMCDGPTLRLGEQYLMYTHRLGHNPDIPLRGCTRSRHVSEAAEDLRYLESRESAPAVGRIYGTVVIDSESPNAKAAPLARAKVQIHSRIGRHSTVTDTKGRYSFNNLEPGEYSVTVDKPGFWIPHEYTPGPVKIHARGCGEVGVSVLKK